MAGAGFSAEYLVVLLPFCLVTAAEGKSLVDLAFQQSPAPLLPNQVTAAEGKSLSLLASQKLSVPSSAVAR